MYRQSAFTLFEIIVTIVLLAITSTAFLSVYSNMVSGSADPVIEQQAITVAEAYMEEILRKPYKDPRDPTVPETGSAEAGESRASFNDVQDYNALPANQNVRDQNDNPIAALAGYSVTVAVQAALLSGVNAMQIDVTVTHPVSGAILLSAFRTEY
jgi:MSHA pilin protein MshD